VFKSRAFRDVILGAQEPRCEAEGDLFGDARPGFVTVRFQVR